MIIWAEGRPVQPRHLQANAETRAYITELEDCLIESLELILVSNGFDIIPQVSDPLLQAIIDNLGKEAK